MADTLYLYDALTAETLYLAGGTDGFHLPADGFTPATGDLHGAHETIHVYCDDAINTVEAAYSELMAWLRRAEEAYHAGQQRIYLYYQPSSRTYTRRALVHGGTARKTLWESTHRAAQRVDIEIVIERGPSELSEVVTLKNLVQNPSFEYDTDGDGVPDDWTAAGSIDISLSSLLTVHGRYTARIATENTSDYLQSDTIIVSSGSTYEFAIYSATYDINTMPCATLHRSDTGAVIATLKNTSPSSTPTRTWTTVICPTSGVFIRLYDDNQTGLYVYFDALYLGLRNTYDGLDLNHGMWSDYYLLDNHDDWEWDNANGAPYAAGTHQNSTHRMTLDILDIPGDLPPDLQTKIYISSESTNCAGQYPLVAALACPYASKTFLTLQAEDATAHASPTLGTKDDASGPSSDNCYLLPLTSSSEYFLTWTISEQDALRLSGHMVRAYARLANVSSAESAYIVQWSLVRSTITPVSTDWYNANLDGNDRPIWKWCPGPTFRFPPGASRREGLAWPDSISLRFYAMQASGITCWIDCIALVPMDGFVQGGEIEARAAPSGEYYSLIGDDWHEIRRVTGADKDKINWRLPGVIGQLPRYQLHDELRLWILSVFPEGYQGESQTEVTLYVRPRYTTL